MYHLFLGENVAVCVELKKEPFLLTFTKIALAATSVSVTGGITFIDLMAPQLPSLL
ncbi:hypothetical protein DFR57_104180 [Saliterribacillus persicus]|uniref:Uncharacterized protein n=1 Tax=Saliterribacillus persicus TaxID=930114 RepID=A0A368XYX9_9BACI|nr:hypothetical protein DFR57_104180 [Saliterribacillus persicus]